ncbi:hypothetical protein B0H12DRAFT_1134081, partial [Mycena haematopus]
MIAGSHLRLGNAPSGPASLRAVQIWCRGWLQGPVCPRVRRTPPQLVPLALLLTPVPHGLQVQLPTGAHHV